MLSFAMPSRLKTLGTPTIQNQMSLTEISFLESFTQCRKKICPRFSNKSSVLVLLQRKILLTIFVEYLYKNIHNLGIKMFYEN